MEPRALLPDATAARAPADAAVGVRLPQAVLWDLDGTLIDSSALWRTAYGRLAARLGGRLTPSVWERLVGRGIEDSVVRLRAELGAPDQGATSGELSDWLVARARRLCELQAPVPWRAGAREALAVVQGAGLPTALVTTTPRQLAASLLARLGVSFDAVVCGDDVALGKPRPEPYLAAAALLGVDVTACVAVEDSATGVAAAEAAGAHVLVVPSGAAIGHGPRRTLRRTLAGLTVAELAASLDAGTRVGRARAGR